MRLCVDMLLETLIGGCMPDAYARLGSRNGSGIGAILFVVLLLISILLSFDNIISRWCMIECKG